MNSLPDCIISEEIFSFSAPSFWDNLQAYHVCRRFRSLLSKRMRPRLDVVMGQKRVNFWNLVMRDAAREGFDDLVAFSIERGAADWNLGLYGAASGGNRALIDYFIKRGNPRIGDLDHALTRANDPKTAEHLVGMGAGDWKSGLETAVVGENSNLIEFFVEMGKSTCPLFSSPVGLASYFAAKHGNLGLLVKYFAGKDTERWTRPVYVVAKRGKHWDVVDYLKRRNKRKRDA